MQETQGGNIRFIKGLVIHKTNIQLVNAILIYEWHECS